MGTSAQWEKGWVPAAAMRSPFSRARTARLVRSDRTSRRAASMSAQTEVPSSTTGWCSSGLAFPSRRRSAEWKISATCERSSRVTGSMTWNSSSMPMLREGAFMGMASPRGGRAAQPLRPVAGELEGPRVLHALDEELGGVLQHPGEVVLPHREEVAVGGGVHEIDGDGDAVPHRELQGVEVVPQGVAEGQAVPLDPLQ